MSEQYPFTLPMPQEDAESLKLEASVLSPVEAKKIEAVATVISQTINAEYSRFIPQATMEANIDLGKRVIVTDDSVAFEQAWSLHDTTSTTPQHLTGVSFQFGGIITVLDPEKKWSTYCSHCKAQDIQRLGSEAAAKEQYKVNYLTTTIAHEEAHQYQDFSNPGVFRELGAYYYAAEISKRLGQRPHGDHFAGKRYDAYATLVRKYGDEVHRVFFGSVENPITKLKKPLIMHEVQKQKDALFSNGQDL